MENTTGARKVIFDDINGFCEDKSRYKALYINMYKLDAKYRSSVYRNELENMFLPLVKDGLAKTFFMRNDDFLVVYEKSKEDELSSLLVKICFLFQEDELLKGGDNIQKSGVAVFFDMENEYVALRKKIESLYEGERKIETPLFYEIGSKGGNANKKAFTTEMLSKIQKIISISDFSSFIRRQAVCAIIGKSTPQRVFEEVLVSIDDVGESLLPDVNVNTNPWLKLALAEDLNKRVLEVISRHEDGDLPGNFSVNINVSSILSDEFIQFDDSINGAMRSTIILELQLEDIFSDMNSYILARTFAKARGYKICIDGITADKLKYINREKLDCDLMKIEWSNSLIDMFSKDEHFMDYMNKAERAKIILCNIENAEAVDAGNNLGINMYQGRYVQRLLNDKK